MQGAQPCRIRAEPGVANSFVADARKLRVSPKAHPTQKPAWKKEKILMIFSCVSQVGGAGAGPSRALCGVSRMAIKGGALATTSGEDSREADPADAYPARRAAVGWAQQKQEMQGNCMKRMFCRMVPLRAAAAADKNLKLPPPTTSPSRLRRSTSPYSGEARGGRKSNRPLRQHPLNRKAKAGARASNALPYNSETSIRRGGH